jgi:hypothetical protein
MRGCHRSTPRFIVSSGERQWGEIRCGGVCKDDYARIKLWGNGQVQYKLQNAALVSLLDANEDIARRLHRKEFTTQLTGSWRSCDTAHDLFARDPSRYAPPDKGAHMRGLAIDVTTAYATEIQHVIRTVLGNHSWHQARPDDESWHFSFGIQV